MGGQSTVLILTSQQVDSLAATKILSTLLAADCLPHSIKPIQGYDYLAKTNESLLADNDVVRTTFPFTVDTTIISITVFTLGIKERGQLIPLLKNSIFITYASQPSTAL